MENSKNPSPCAGKKIYALLWVKKIPSWKWNLRLPDGESTSLLEWMRKQGYSQPFIIMTQYEDIHAAIHAMKLSRGLYETVDRRQVAACNGKNKEQESVVFQVIYERKSKAFNELYHYIRLVAPTDMSVLIWGNGNWKGTFENCGNIHRQSLRANKPYVTVDCGMLPKRTCCIRFFRCLKGAFTGALKEKAGNFLKRMAAHCLLMRWRIFRLRHSRCCYVPWKNAGIVPVGGGQDRRSDVRIIAATNENLHKAVAEKRFRGRPPLSFAGLYDDGACAVPLPWRYSSVSWFFRRQYSEKWQLEVSDFDEAKLKECCWNIAGRAMCVNWNKWFR